MLIFYSATLQMAPHAAHIFVQMHIINLLVFIIKWITVWWTEPNELEEADISVKIAHLCFEMCPFWMLNFCFIHFVKKKKSLFFKVSHINPTFISPEDMHSNYSQTNNSCKEFIYESDSSIIQQ